MDEQRNVARRPGDVVLGAVAVGLLLFDVLRAWLPTLVVVIGEGRGVGTLGLMGIVLATLGVGPMAALSVPHVPPRVLWILGGALLLGGRLALALSTGGGAPQFIATTVAVGGGALAVVGLAAGAPRGDVARIGLLAGTALSFALQAALGGVDLIWRDSILARLVSLVLVLGAGLLVARATRQLDGGRTPAAWPWAMLGPALVLFGVLGGPAGRIAVATGWGPGTTAAAAIALQAVVVLGALAAARVGPLAASPAAAVLVVAGTSLALPASSLTSVLGQAALLLGVGLALGSGPHGGSTGPRRRGLVAGASTVLLGLLVLLAYAGYRTQLPIGVRGVMLVSATFVALSSLVGAVRAARLGREAPAPMLAVSAVLTLAVALLLAGPASLRGTAPAPEPSAAGTLRIALANVHFGFDVEGRLRAREVAQILGSLDADLIALNEVDRGWFISGAPDLLATYAAATGMEAVFGPASDEVWGNAVLTRLPVLEVDRVRLPRGRDPLSRTALTVIVEQPDGLPLALVVVHLSDVDMSGETRLPQAQSVAAIVARLRERGILTIVAGDLNAPPGDPALEALQGIGLRTVLPETVRTFPAAAPRVQIDHVLVPPTLDVLSARAFNSGASDHRFVETVLVRTAPTDPSALGVDGTRD